MAWDFCFDQSTGDTVPDGKGSIVTTETAQTQIYCQFKSIYAAWWGDSNAGSKLAVPSIMQADPIAVQAEALRTLNVLVAVGSITNPVASAEADQDVPGRIELTTTSRDSRTGRVLTTGNGAPPQ